MSGLIADSRTLIDKARVEAQVCTDTSRILSIVYCSDVNVELFQQPVMELETLVENRISVVEMQLPVGNL